MRLPRWSHRDRATTCILLGGSGADERGHGALSGVLAIIWHSRTGAARTMAEAAFAGACEAGEVVLIAAETAQPDAMLAARGYLFAAPENLGTMSGAMKEFFDRCYYPLLGQIEGRAYATLIAVMRAQTPEAILAPKRVDPAVLARCREMGQALTEGLALGVF